MEEFLDSYHAFLDLSKDRSFFHGTFAEVIEGNVGGLRDNATPAMVCTANDLHEWKDFPKGLRVLLLEQDSTFAEQLKAKLEALDYIVSTFCNEDAALAAITDKCENFHVAIVEVCSSNNNGTFKFLETARDLPTIMISNIHCLNTMMKCIALGAVEFLHKPLCDDKLKNIWQHVVHKAFNAGTGLVSESLKPVKESLVSMLQLQLQNGENEPRTRIEQSSGGVIGDKYPAPSTPQLEHGVRLMDDGDCHDGESKSVETTFDNCSNVVRECEDDGVRNAVVKEEDDSSASCLQEKKPGSSGSDSKASDLHQKSKGKGNRKKVKVDWTHELHKKFVHAVEQLGVDQAIPSRILEIMKVEGLTRHNVASHLQKYRMHRRHILPKEDDRRWRHQSDPVSRNYYQHRPIMAFPPYHPNPSVAPGFGYPTPWGAQGNHQASMQMWGPPSLGYPPWQAVDNWQWRPYAGVHADAWGCPVMQPHHGSSYNYPQNLSGYHYPGPIHNLLPPNSFDLHPEEEIIDKLVKEAISKPWLPLPLGLKPPSTEGVLAELSRQGVPCMPPHHNPTVPL